VQVEWDFGGYIDHLPVKLFVVCVLGVVPSLTLPSNAQLCQAAALISGDLRQRQMDCRF
jgi:hypothetical protein